VEGASPTTQMVTENRKRVRTDIGEDVAKKLRETEPSSPTLDATEHVVALRLKDAGIKNVELVDNNRVLKKCVRAVDRVLSNKTTKIQDSLKFAVARPSPTTTRMEIHCAAERLFAQLLETERKMAEQKVRLENKLKNVMRIMEVVGTCESLKDAYMYAVDYVDRDIMPDLSCYDYDDDVLH